MSNEIVFSNAPLYPVAVDEHKQPSDLSYDKLGRPQSRRNDFGVMWFLVHAWESEIIQARQLSLAIFGTESVTKRSIILDRARKLVTAGELVEAERGSFTVTELGRQRQAIHDANI